MLSSEAAVNGAIIVDTVRSGYEVGIRRWIELESDTNGIEDEGYWGGWSEMG